MKSALYRMAMATAVAMLALAARAQEADTSVPVGELVKPSEEAGKTTETLQVFLKKSITAYQAEDAKLRRLEEEYKAADASSKDDATKRKVALKYLEARQATIRKMLDDFEFVNGKLQEQVGVINGLVGDMKTQKALAERAAKAAEDTQAIVAEIEKLKLANREIKSQAPEPGTPAYVECYKKNTELRLQFRQAVGNLRRSMQSAFVYKELANGLEMNQTETAQWQGYVAELSLIFTENKADLEAARAMTDQYIQFVKAGDAFGGIADFGEFAKEFGGIVGRVSEQPPVVVGTIKPGAPPPPPPLPPLEDFDPVKFQEEYKAKLSSQKK